MHHFCRGTEWQLNPKQKRENLWFNFQTTPLPLSSLLWQRKPGGSERFLSQVFLLCLCRIVCVSFLVSWQQNECVCISLVCLWSLHRIAPVLFGINNPSCTAWMVSGMRERPSDWDGRYEEVSSSPPEYDESDDDGQVSSGIVLVNLNAQLKRCRTLPTTSLSGVTTHVAH